MQALSPAELKENDNAIIEGVDFLSGGKNHKSKRPTGKKQKGKKQKGKKQTRKSGKSQRSSRKRGGNPYMVSGILGAASYLLTKRFKRKAHNKTRRRR